LRPIPGLSFEINQSAPVQFTIDPAKLALYLDFFDRYPCPYYTDRADLIAPEINRLAQFLRSFGSKVVLRTATVLPTPVSEVADLKNFTDNHMDDTSPLFADKCLFDEFTEHPARSSGAVHHDIRYSTASDLFADSHRHAARLGVQLNVSHVLVAGMLCNLWVPSFFETLTAAGIVPMWLTDLSDVAFHRPSQVGRLKTHSEAITLFQEWLLGRGYATVDHWSILAHAHPPSPAAVALDGNKAAFHFDWYFA
jgi:hypothetical protein